MKGSEWPFYKAPYFSISDHQTRHIQAYNDMIYAYISATNVMTENGSLRIQYWSMYRPIYRYFYTNTGTGLGDRYPPLVFYSILYYTLLRYAMLCYAISDHIIVWYNTTLCYEGTIVLSTTSSMHSVVEAAHFGDQRSHWCTCGNAYLRPVILMWTSNSHVETSTIVLSSIAHINRLFTWACPLFGLLTLLTDMRD